MHSLREDIRIALRVLARRPLATLAAVIAFGLGIGFNTAMFSSAEVLMLRPLLIPDQDRAVQLSTLRLNDGHHSDNVTAAEYEAVRDSGVLANTSAATFWSANLTSSGGDPANINVFRVTPEFFDMAALPPAAGRYFASTTNDRVIVLGYNLWEHRFGADPRVIGSTVSLDGAAHVIVGVMPKGFRYPVPAEAWTPLVFSGDDRHNAVVFRYTVSGRLKPGTTLEQARAAFVRTGAQLAAQYPQSLGSRRPDLDLIRNKISGDLTPQYTKLNLVADLFLLLIACANVAGLQLAHAASRLREVGVRSALGASRWRLVRLFLVENAILAVLGAGLGLVIAAWGLDLMRAHMPPEVEQFLPGWYRMGLSPLVLVYTALMTALAAFAAGILPAWTMSSAGFSLHSSGRGYTRSRHLLRSLLVAGQVCVSLVLLVGAFLLVKGFGVITQPRPNLDPEHLLTFRIALPVSRYATPAARADLQRRILEKITALSGVRRAGLVLAVPYGNGDEGRRYRMENRPLAPGETRPWAYFQPSSGGNLAAMNIPLLAGRALNASDGPEAQRVAVVSEAFARRNGQGQVGDLSYIIGRALYAGDKETPENRYTIVGVAGDIVQDFTDRAPQPMIYVSYLQAPQSDTTFLLRTEGDPARLVPAARDVVRDLDAQLPLFDVKTQAKVISDQLCGIAYMAVLMGVLGAVAMFLAVLGIFSLVAHNVEERTRELGVRIALGAQPGDVVWVVGRRALLLVAAGLAVGLPLAFGVARLLASVLFGVSPSDVSAFAGVPALLAATAAAACWWPARRALKTDPVTALRHE